MIYPRHSLTLALGAVLIAASLHAADGQPPLIDDLRQIVEKSRREKAADRWLQSALEDLLARHDSPWQREILYEDFSDGDYTSNPSWQVLRGQFQVVRGQGLYSAADAPAGGAQAGTPSQQQSATDALSGLIVGALIDRALGTGSSQTQGGAANTAPTAGPGAIRLKADVSNAFAIELAFRHASGTESAFEIALLQSEAGNYGYRLRLHSGARGFVELQRVRGGRGAIVETRDLARSYADGMLHELAWRQGPDGSVTVMVDGETLFSVRDRAFRDPYPWLQLLHDQGELTVRSLRIKGV